MLRRVNIMDSNQQLITNDILRIRDYILLLLYTTNQTTLYNQL